MAQPGFDAEDVAAFATTVMRQDGAASEMNQRGMRSPAFRAARLMPEEYEIARFQAWVRSRDGGCAMTDHSPRFRPVPEDWDRRGLPALDLSFARQCSTWNATMSS